MKRRAFIAMLVGVVAWTLSASAQQPTRDMQRIGVLMPFAKDDPQYKARIGAFLDGLRKAGRSDGQNVRIDYCASPGTADEIQRCAERLISTSPTVIMATG